MQAMTVKSRTFRADDRKEQAYNILCYNRLGFEFDPGARHGPMRFVEGQMGTLGRMDCYRVSLDPSPPLAECTASEARKCMDWSDNHLIRNSTPGTPNYNS